MITKIKNIRLRTIIGINDWERKKRQDIVINIEAEFDGAAAVKSDNIQDTVDYKALTKRIINDVEKSKFYLLEKLADYILQIVLEDKKVVRARITVDKPHALRFTDSVSITCSAARSE